ncbi:MAG: hypothetical protein ACYDAG_02410 [Chloroflexota bacterium]
MNRSVLGLALVIGPMFALLGAAAAYAITYEEYSHHGFGRQRLMIMSLRSAAVSFFVLLLLTFAAVWVLSPRG